VRVSIYNRGFTQHMKNSYNFGPAAQPAILLSVSFSYNHMYIRLPSSAKSPISNACGRHSQTPRPPPAALRSCAPALRCGVNSPADRRDRVGSRALGRRSALRSHATLWSCSRCGTSIVRRRPAPRDPAPMRHFDNKASCSPCPVHPLRQQGGCRQLISYYCCDWTLMPCGLSCSMSTVVIRL
jgi:hypothetical protein